MEQNFLFPNSLRAMGSGLCQVMDVRKLRERGTVEQTGLAHA